MGKRHSGLIMGEVVAASSVDMGDRSGDQSRTGQVMRETGGLKIQRKTEQLPPKNLKVFFIKCPYLVVTTYLNHKPSSSLQQYQIQKSDSLGKMTDLDSIGRELCIKQPEDHKT